METREDGEKREKNDWTRQAIVVRKRTESETRDLAFLVIGKEFKNLAFYFAALAVPVFLLDALFFALFIFRDPSEIAAPDVAGGVALFWKNCFVYAVVALETWFVGSLATRYLGVWLFESEREIERREIFSSWLARAPQLVYYLVLTRPFRFASFYAETILLEQTTFRKKSGRYSTSERVRSFRRGAAVEPNLWPALAAVVGYFMIDALGPTLVATGALWEAAFHWAIFPAFLFGLRFYVVVLNFLRYINYRVATEGWDLDLAFKVERAKLAVDAERWRAGGRGVAASALALDLTSAGDERREKNEETRENQEQENEKAGAESGEV
ncbi:MAG: hypothetical protein IJ991_16130 [Thermoguttaceae bacterium]|nr:hypothetical protein [Thermoguttaceae bacterium]